MKQTLSATCMALVALLGLAFAGCKSAAGDGTSAAARRSAPSPDHTENVGFSYPPTRWRLATLPALDAATVWVGHIAIRHEASETELFRPPEWRPDSSNPRRTVAEALALAERVRARAVRAPDTFETLAREFSEDVVSKDQGGMLGGVRVSQLVNTDFLDALTVLKVGEVSRPFRTPYGFHILKRYAPPPEEQVAGERIVIGYRGVYGLAAGSRRTREQAQELAKEVAALAKKDPRSFPSLVERYSDNADRASHGDLGVYSTRDPGGLPAEVQVLAALRVGDVADPIDSRFGFEILRRVPVVPRKAYAMTAIEVVTGDGFSNRASAMAEALKIARGIRLELKSAPQRWDEFQTNYCCAQVQRWTRGRGDNKLSDVLDGLAFGEIAPEPIERPAGYILIKRLDPAGLPPESRLFEVPNPSDPDYAVLASTVPRQQVVALARAFIGAIGAKHLFTGATAAKVKDVLEKLAAYLEQNEVDNVATASTLRSTLASLENQLDKRDVDKLETFGRRWIVSQMMPPGSVADTVADPVAGSLE